MSRFGSVFHVNVSYIVHCDFIDFRSSTFSNNSVHLDAHWGMWGLQFAT